MLYGYCHYVSKINKEVVMGIKELVMEIRKLEKDCKGIPIKLSMMTMNELNRYYFFLLNLEEVIQ